MTTARPIPVPLLADGEGMSGGKVHHGIESADGLTDVSEHGARRAYRAAGQG